MATPEPAGRSASECLRLLGTRSRILFDGGLGDDPREIPAGEPVDGCHPRRAAWAYPGGTAASLAIAVMSAADLFHGCWLSDSAAKRARREEFVEAVDGYHRFNEAAGFTGGNRARGPEGPEIRHPSFNEAAGIHRRKRGGALEVLKDVDPELQ